MGQSINPFAWPDVARTIRSVLVMAETVMGGDLRLPAKAVDVAVKHYEVAYVELVRGN